MRFLFAILSLFVLQAFAALTLDNTVTINSGSYTNTNNIPYPNANFAYNDQVNLDLTFTFTDALSAKVWVFASASDFETGVFGCGVLASVAASAPATLSTFGATNLASLYSTGSVTGSTSFSYSQTDLYASAGTNRFLLVCYQAIKDEGNVLSRGIYIKRAAQIVGDPSFVGFQGQAFQVHGTPDEHFNLITSPSFNLNSRFRYMGAEFATSCTYNNTACWSHPGTYMSSLGFRTKNHQIFVLAGTHEQGIQTVVVDGRQISEPTELKALDGEGYFSVSKDSFVFINDEFHLIAVNSHEFFNLQATMLDNKALLAGSKRVVVKSESEALPYPELPIHGLLGQTWKNIAYPGNSFILGDVDDYIVDGIFGTNYRFNKF